MEASKQQVTINFDPEQHRYTDSNGDVYTSVTTVIGQYKKPFNRRYWSMYKALESSGFKVRQDKNKKGIFVDGVYRGLDSLYNNPINNHEVVRTVTNWNNITEEACARGNKIHDYLEDTINKSKNDIEGNTNTIVRPFTNFSSLDLSIFKTEHDLESTGLQNSYPDIFKRLLMYIKKGCVLFAEKKVFNVYYKIAGMIDVLVVHFPSKRFCIVDWKTNKDEMKFNSGYYKKEWVKGIKVKTNNYILKDDRLLSPINNLQDCKGIVYSLQLSLYAFLMELWGYKLAKNGLEIFHIRPERRPKLIKIDYYKEDIIKMLNHHKNKNTKNNTLFGIQ